MVKTPTLEVSKGVSVDIRLYESEDASDTNTDDLWGTFYSV